MPSGNIDMNTFPATATATSTATFNLPQGSVLEAVGFRIASAGIVHCEAYLSYAGRFVPLCHGFLRNNGTFFGTREPHWFGRITIPTYQPTYLQVRVHNDTGNDEEITVTIVWSKEQ